MTTRVLSWGLLVAAAWPALPACSAAPPEVAAPPAPATTSAAPAPPAPEGGFGPFVPLSAEDQPPAASTRDASRFHSARTFFGRGVLTTVGDRAASDNCPLQDAKEVCGAFTLTVTDQDPGDELWRTGEAPSTSVTRRIVALFPEDWTAFSGGRDRVYAFTPGQIDEINEKGEVHLLVSSDDLPEWEQFQVIEVGERRLILGHSDNSELQVGEVMAGAPGQPRTLSPLTGLGISSLSRYRPRAQAAREVESDKKHATYGVFSAFATKDAPPSGHQKGPASKGSKAPKTAKTKGPRAGGGGDAGQGARGSAEWALVWVEVLPPPFKWPPGKAYKRRGRHECGGPSSRSVEDPSVEKRIHVTRFEGTKQVSDKSVLSLNKFEFEAPFAVRPTDKGVEINGITYDRKGKSVETRAVKVTRFAPATMEPDEQVLATAFDAAKGEGATVYWSGDKARWRTFDGQGKPIGPSLPLAGDPSRGASLYEDHPILSFTTGGWWLSALGSEQLMSLDRNALVPTEHWNNRFFPNVTPPMQIEVEGSAMRRRRFDPKTGAFAAETEPLDEKWGEYSMFQHIEGASPWTSFIARAQTPGDEPSPLVRFDPNTGHWSEIAGAIPEEIGRINNFTAHQVWGDLAVRVNGTEGSAVTWLKAGKTIVYLKKDKQGLSLVNKEKRRGNLYSPLVDEGARMLPPRPGPLIETPELEGIGARCEHILPTAPGTLTMICAEAVHKDKPGVRVGIQTFHFRE